MAGLNYKKKDLEKAVQIEIDRTRSDRKKEKVQQYTRMEKTINND